MATVEIKYSTSPSISRGYYSALEDIGTEKNYIVVPGNTDYPYKDKARIVGIKTFLEKYIGEI